MALGYQRIIQNNGHCPMVLATGGLSCGKTTSLMSMLSTIGNHKTGNSIYTRALILINKMLVIMGSYILTYFITELYSHVHQQSLYNIKCILAAIQTSSS